jgi:decaprenylphosphoryl-5-phosphoribose phosphatase
MRKGLERLDRGVLRTMRTRWHDPRAEAGLRAVAAAGEWGAAWVTIGLAAAALDKARRGRWLSAGAVAPAAVGINYAVKLAVRRPRPRLRRLPPLAGAPSSLSFPSAHATSSLAAASAMARVAPEARIPLYALAGAIGLTRPYLGMHYPSDVLGGFALGLLIGRLWPGVGPKDVEDRLIDLVAGSARHPPPDGDGAGARRPTATAGERPDPLGHRP